MADLKIRCDKCGSELTYKPGTETLVCAYCGNTVKIPTQAVKPEDITDTDLIIPLQIQEDALTNAIRLYMTQGKLTPDDLVQKATVTKQILKYVPFYLYHGEFHANWTASFGYERREGSGSNSHTVTDWRPASGAVNGPFSLLGYAGNDEIDKNCAELLADQDRSKMVPFDAKYLSGFSNDKFELTERETYQLYVESRVGDMVASEVKANAQGDEQKDWHWSGSQSYDTKTLYLPVGLSVFEYKGKEYKVWVDGVDPTRFTGDPLPEDPHKQQMEYLGWVPFAVTLCFSVMLVMGKGEDALTGAMLAVILLTGLYAFLRKSAIADYSKKLRKAILTQVQAADIDTTNASPEQLAEISKSYTLPKKPLLAKTENDKFVLPIITIVAIIVTLIPAPGNSHSIPQVTARTRAEAPKSVAAAATSRARGTADQGTNSRTESGGESQASGLAPNINDALIPYHLQDTLDRLSKMINSMANDGTFVQTYANEIREQPIPSKGDRATARALNKEALTILRSGDVSSAVDKFADAVKADPTDVEVVDNLGFALLRSGRIDEAEHALIAALSLDPNRAGAWFNFGEVLARDGRNTEAAPYAMMVGYKYCNAARKQKTKQFWNRQISDPDTDPKVVAAMKTALSIIQQRESANTGGQQY